MRMYNIRDLNFGCKEYVDNKIGIISRINFDKKNRPRKFIILREEKKRVCKFPDVLEENERD